MITLDTLNEDDGLLFLRKMLSQIFNDDLYHTRTLTLNTIYTYKMKFLYPFGFFVSRSLDSGVLNAT